MTAHTDGRSDFTQYADTGCEIAPRCQQCPLPDCRFALDPMENRAAMVMARNFLIRKTWRAGATVRQIAEAGEISERTVERVLRKETA